VAEFLYALRRVAAGGPALDPMLWRSCWCGGLRPAGQPDLAERGVLALMAEANSNAELAASS